MKLLFVYTTILLLIFTTTLSFAQQAGGDSVKNTVNLKVPKSYWATLGLGGGTVGLLAASTANAQLWGSSLVTASLQYEQNLNFNILGPPEGYNVNVDDYNLLFGKIFKEKVSFISVSAGLGVVHVVSFTDSAYVISKGTGGFFSFDKYGSIPIDQKNRYALNIPILT